MSSTDLIEMGQGDLIQALPFSEGEYHRRLTAVRAAMSQQGLEAFVSFSPENINWLTGHDTPAYHYMQASVITHDRPPVNVIRGIDATNTLSRTWSRQVVRYADHQEPMDVLAGFSSIWLDQLRGSEPKATASLSAPADSTCCAARLTTA
jgi:Xaa-Pro dipeptidase